MLVTKAVDFSRLCQKKTLNYFPNRRKSTIAFNLGFVLLLAKVNPIPEEQSRKNDVLVSCGINCIKMILILLTEVIAFLI